MSVVENNAETVYIPASSGFAVLNVTLVTEPQSFLRAEFPIIAWDVGDSWSPPAAITVVGFIEQEFGRNVRGIKCPDGSIHIDDEDPFAGRDLFVAYAERRLLSEHETQCAHRRQQEDVRQ